MHACARLQVRAIRERGTFDVGADVVLAAVRAEVDLRRRLVHLRRRAEETHRWMDECSEAELEVEGKIVL